MSGGAFPLGRLVVPLMSWAVPDRSKQGLCVLFVVLERSKLRTFRGKIRHDFIPLESFCRNSPRAPFKKSPPPLPCAWTGGGLVQATDTSRTPQALKTGPKARGGAFDDSCGQSRKRRFDRRAAGRPRPDWRASRGIIGGDYHNPSPGNRRADGLRSPR